MSCNHSLSFPILDADGEINATVSTGHYSVWDAKNLCRCTSLLKQNGVRIGKAINKEPDQYAVLILISGRNNNIGTVSVKVHQFLSLVIGQFSTGFHTRW